MTTIKKDFIYNSLYQILTIFIPLFTTPYLSRILGASGIGVYSYYFSIASYFALFILLGLNNYGNREIAKCRDNSEEVSKKFWSIYAMQLSMGVIVCLVYLVYIYVCSEKIVSAIFGLYVLAECFDINWFCFGTGQFKLIAFRNTIVKVVSTISIFIFVNNTKDVWLYCLIIAGGQIVSCFIIWPKTIKKVKFYKPSPNEVFVHIKPNLILFMTVIAVSLFKIMDKIMLGMFTNSEQVGFYELSEKIIAIPTTLITSLGTVMLPTMSNMIYNNTERSNKIIYLSMIFEAFLVSSLSFGIMGVSREFIPLFYGKGYDTCIYLYLILLPSCLFLGFGNVIRTQYLLPRSMDKVYLTSAFLGAFVNIVLNLCFIPRFGAIGAAIGTLAAEASVCIYQSIMCKNELNLKQLIKKSLVFIVAGFFMFIVIFFVNLSFVESTIYKLILKIILGIIIYFVVLIIEEIIYRIMYNAPLLDVKLFGRKI